MGAARTAWQRADLAWPIRQMLTRIAVCMISGSIPCACKDLPSITPDECGNYVVESAEECDGFSPAKSRCLPPGDENECRFGCAEYLDPDTNTRRKPSCPDAMSCGTDGVCRSGSDEFVSWGDFVPGPAASLQLGDLDADGRDDLLALGNAAERWDSHPRVFFFDEQGHATPALDPLTPLNSPIIGRLISENPLSPAKQIIGGTQFGLAVLFANPAHEIASVPYPFQVNNQEAAYALIRLKGVRSRPLGEEVVLHYLKPGSLKTAIAQTELANGLPLPIGGMVAADIIETGAAPSCDELVYTVSGDRQVYALSVCNPDGTLRFSAEGPRPVAVLSEGHSPSTKPILAKLNDDDHLDLVVGDENGYTHVAYGRGNGTFSADSSAAIDSAGPLWPVLAYSPDDPAVTVQVPCPLAIGDLVRPGQHDWVLPSGIYIIEGVVPDPVQHAIKGVPYASNFPSSGTWKLALITDVTGDGRMDLVASSDESSNLDVYAGTGGPLLNGLAIPTRGPVKELVAGDYNGDQLIDIAMMLEQTEPTAPDTAPYSLAIAFSERDDGPTEAVEVARFDSFDQLLSANYQTNDAIEEIGVLSSSQTDQTQHLTLFMGSHSRPISSFGLSRSTANSDYTTAVPMASALIQGATPGILSVAVDECYGDDCHVGLWYTSGTGTERLSTPQFLGAIPEEPPISEGTNIYLVTAQFAPRFAIADTNWRDKNPTEEAFLFTFSTTLRTLRLWQIALPTATQGEATSPALSLIDSIPGRLLSASSPKLVDLDKDGWKELVFSVADTETKQRQLIVLWSDSGSFSFSRASSIAGDDPINDLAVFGPAKAQRLFAVTNRGLFEIVARNRLLELVPIAGETGAAVPGGQALAMGDMTGDGLPDLAIAVPGGLRLYAQVER